MDPPPPVEGEKSLLLSTRQMEAVYWVAKLKSFSSAARQLNITQPAVSHRIREVESSLGIVLFDRSRSLTPTPEGRDILSLAERFLILNEELMIRSVQTNGHSGIIRIGAADTVALTWLAPLISKLSADNQRLSVEISIDLSFNLMSKLTSGVLDLCFLVGGSPGPGYKAAPLGQVENVWMAAPGLVPKGAKQTPGTIAKFPVVTHTAGSHLHAALNNWFVEHGVERPQTHVCNSLAGMIEITAAGLGVAALPRGIAFEPLHSGRLEIIPTIERLPATRFSCVFSEGYSAILFSEILHLAAHEVSLHPWFDPILSEDVPIGY